MNRVREEKESTISPKARANFHKKATEILSRAPEPPMTRSKSKDNSKQSNHMDRRSGRVLRSPRKQERRSPVREVRRSERHSSSIFSRIGPVNSKRRSYSRSKSRSRSPPRKMTSTIGSVIKRRSISSSDEDHSANHSMSSVVKVTDRPKRDLKLSNKMLLRAVADAQQSIIQTEQSSPKKPEPSHNSISQEQPRKRSSDENKNIGVIAKRRFNEFPEVDTPDFYEPTDAATRRKSVKERLGVKREIRRPVKERLGVIESHPSYSNIAFSNLACKKFLSGESF